MSASHRKRDSREALVRWLRDRSSGGRTSHSGTLDCRSPILDCTPFPRFSIESLQFGFWNKEAGPDFVHALIRVNGIQTLAGDIELDLSAADWERHLHGENPAFQNVVLHVFLRHSGVACFTRTIEHREVLQLELTQDYRSIIVETEIDPAKPGACCGPLARFPDQKVNHILETAARLEVRPRRSQ